MQNVMLAAVVIGVVLGAVGGAISMRYLASMATRRSRISRKSAHLGAVLGGSFALLPSFFFSFVVGGNFGGGWGEFFAGQAGVGIGLAAAVAIVLGGGLACGAAAGVLAAVLVARLFGGGNAV